MTRILAALVAVALAALVAAGVRDAHAEACPAEIGASWIVTDSASGATVLEDELPLTITVTVAGRPVVLHLVAFDVTESGWEVSYTSCPPPLTTR